MKTPAAQTIQMAGVSHDASSGNHVKPASIGGAQESSVDLIASTAGAGTQGSSHAGMARLPIQADQSAVFAGLRPGQPRSACAAQASRDQLANRIRITIQSRMWITPKSPDFQFCLEQVLRLQCDEIAQ